ncbi:hypothetical protein G4228_011972 [Cervus hanglu yarkandensis]|nr:hypothetical protein G4228_011972 [Cervus hanglu yarkandensis]
MIAGQVSKPLLSVRSEMNAELRGEDKAATSDSELNEPLLAPVESNDSEDTPSKLFVYAFNKFNSQFIDSTNICEYPLCGKELCSEDSVENHQRESIT